MEFLGLPAQQLLKLFAVGGGAIVLLYILKLRRRRLPVPYAKLWERILLERPTSSLFSQLRRLLSLLLQLLLLGLMVFAVGDPRKKAVTTNGRHLVVLLDGSASMKATDVPGGREGAARQAAEKLIAELGTADRMLLAQMDRLVTPLSPFTDEMGALRTALRDYEPRDTGLEFPAALRFAQDALRGQSLGEIIVIGDGQHGSLVDHLGEVGLAPDVKLRFVPVGKSGRNLGISAFSARRYPLDKSRYEVLVEVRNYTDRREEIELTLSADDTPLEVTRLTLEPNASLQRVLADQSGANQTLEARILLGDGSHDDLPADDRAYATLPARRRARVLNVTEGNLYLQAALLLDDYLEVEDVSAAEAPEKLRASQWDVVIMDNLAVPVPPGTNVLYLHPTGADSPMEIEGKTPQTQEVRRPAIQSVESRHPVMRWMSDFEDTNIATATRYGVRQGDKVLAGAHTPTELPLVVAGERHGGKFVALTFDVRQTDLPMRISWPVLLINTIDWFGGEDPAYLSSFKTGETWRIPVPAGTENAELVTPNQLRVRAPVLEGRAVTAGMQAGFYRVLAGGDAQIVAGNLVDPAESQCLPVRELTVSGVKASAPVAGVVGVRKENWLYLLAAALGIILLEWFSYHRRVTV